MNADGVTGCYGRIGLGATNTNTTTQYQANHALFFDGKFAHIISYTHASPFYQAHIAIWHIAEHCIAQWESQIATSTNTNTLTTKYKTLNFMAVMLDLYVH